YWFGTGEARLRRGTPDRQPARPARTAAPQELRQVVRDQLADVLGVSDPATVDTGKVFKELGLDSLTALELRNRLTTATRPPPPPARPPPLPATCGPPAVAEPARFLDEPPPGASVESDVFDLAPPAPAEPIAIVGMACRLPGGVTSPDELWNLVTDGVDAI